MFGFYVNIFLRPVLDEEQLDNQLESNGAEDHAEPSHLKERKEPSQPYSYKQIVDNMLDSSGPKLCEGSRKVLSYYQIISVLNWLKTPLYVSLIYKASVVLLTAFVVIKWYMIPLISLSVLDMVYQNPIFVFVFCLAFITSTAHFWLTIYINLFKLYPMFKIISTPKLCYLSKEAQTIFGDNNLFLAFIFIVYNTCLTEMLVCASYQEFLTNFNIFYFMVNLFSQAVMWYHVIGLAHFDFYIRCCFGSWILGLKMNFETRFERFRIYQRRQLARCLNGPNNLESPEGVGSDNFITLDEIQNQLNNMDDHLEVWRSVLAYSLALISVNAFLMNGTVLLLAYSLLANQGNYYHGLVVLGIAVNYWVAVFFCYSGDQFISYALNKFVQTVEDEYFLQGADDTNDKAMLDYFDDQYQQWFDSTADVRLQTCLGILKSKFIARHRTLLVHKKDVVFCREFLHQFETHLATPWSRLDFTSHLHMLGAFVTLIAAQIIFDNEH